MEKYYSKLHSGVVLHQVHRLQEVVPGRKDLADSNQFLQCAILNLDQGKTFRPHKHVWNMHSSEARIPQESWIVVRGRVQCTFYDIDDTILATPILEPGDASFTFLGGHNYTILEPDTVVYEYKTGPYKGVEFDKVFLEQPE